MKILFTGITGILGSHLFSRLSLYHDVYAVVRNVKHRSHELAGLGMAPDRVFEGDLEEDGLGLSGVALSRLQSAGIDMILHCASSVKFDVRYSERTMNINEAGTRRLVALAKSLNIQTLHFVSTAYAPFGRNPYERSKMAAEKLVISSGLSYNIYRLGVIVGETRNCAINDFNGFYGYAMVPYLIAGSLRSKRKTSGPVELPITIRCSLTSTINIVPVDWVVSQLVLLINLGCFGEIYHITHPHPRLSSWVLSTIFNYLGINGPVCRDRALDTSPKDKGKTGHLQRLFDKQTDIFVPYATEETLFDVSSTMARLGSDYEEPNEVTEAWIHGLLDYAVKRNFGRKTSRTGRRL
jgi:nucleoside-diphosphate-sugar epimerase